LSATIVGTGSAVPGVMRQDELWDDFFARHYAGSRLASVVWSRSGVQTRHAVADPRAEDLSAWSTGARMRRYIAEAVPLGKEALAICLTDAGVGADEVDQLVVASCTGYATPGLDILLSRDLGMPAHLQRLSIGHMGCYAAIPGLATVADGVVARGRTSVLLCLELTSLHIQPATDDREQMVAHALFSDAAAAIALRPGGRGLEFLDVVARTDADRAALMTWDVTDLGFRMGLSPRVPKILHYHVADVVGQLLAPAGLRIDDVAGWAVHPGGPQILDVVAERLELSEDRLAASRATLRDHGNCSSATTLLILQRMLADGGLSTGDHVIAMAFGPGLTLYAALLRVR
jgi:predicted naringenin-chalcone synthase